MRFTKNKLQESKEVINHQGGISYTLSPEQELVKMALTSFVDKSFYETMNEKVKRLRGYCQLVDADFMIKLATWARGKGLRTVNQILMVESLRHPKFEYYFSKLVKRPDELIDIVGYYALVNSQNPKNIKLASKLKRAIGSKLTSFNEYTLAKYKGKKGIVNLYDLVNMTHSYSDAIDKLMKGTIAIADTWESKLSSDGNTAESWDYLLDNNKLGALAFIRNLRNMIQVGVAHVKLQRYLDTIDMSLVFPFQMIQALDMCVQAGLSEKSELYMSLEKKSYEMFEGFARLFTGKVAVGIDVSGSMDDKINDKSSLKRNTLAVYYGMGLQHYGADLYAWNTQCRPSNEWSLEDYRLKSGGTDISCLMDELKGKEYDTVIIITDEQTNSRWRPATKNTIVWNIGDYQHSTVPSFDNGYTYITGFNDAQFKLVNDLRDISGITKSIEQVVLENI